jgi:hypothetical protein
VLKACQVSSAVVIKVLKLKKKTKRKKKKEAPKTKRKTFIQDFQFPIQL